MYTIVLDPENFMTYKKPLYTISGFSIISPRRSKECVTPPLTAGFITMYGDGGSRIDKFYIGLLISEMALYQVFYVYQFSLDKYKILIGSSHFLTTKK